WPLRVLDLLKNHEASTDEEYEDLGNLSKDLGNLGNLLNICLPSQEMEKIVKLVI
ncbi:19757_t:CDS:1, partial [Racocetra fulgida]